MLETKNITESLKIEDGKAYAVFSLEESRRQLDGCQFRSELQVQILNKRKEKEELVESLKKCTVELTELLELDNKLVGAGFCKCDRPVYKKLDGIVQLDENGNPIIDHLTHDEFCKHKEG